LNWQGWVVNPSSFLIKAALISPITFPFLFAFAFAFALR
jgi:hypothetical protein